MPLSLDIEDNFDDLLYDVTSHPSDATQAPHTNDVTHFSKWSGVTQPSQLAGDAGSLHPNDVAWPSQSIDVAWPSEPIDVAWSSHSNVTLHYDVADPGKNHSDLELRYICM
jgi:hypothetical protein